MNRDEEVAYHRTFLPFDPKKDLCKMGCHGTTGTGQRIVVHDYLSALEPADLMKRFRPSATDHKTDLSKRVWEVPNFLFRYEAFQFAGQTSREITIVPKIDQNFKAHASEWEAHWSVLVDTSAKKFRPLLDQNYTVIGHVGTVNEYYVIVPDELPTDSGGVGDVLNDYPNVPLLVLDSLHAHIPEGWRRFRGSQSWYKLTLVTGIDGEVIDVANAEPTNGVAIPTDGPMDYISLGIIAGRVAASIGIAVFKGLGRSLSRVGGRLLAKVLGRKSETTLLSRLKFVYGHQPEMGIPANHFKAFAAAAKETDSILIFRANKASAVSLIENGAPGKPKFFGKAGGRLWKTDPETGILKATDRAQFQLAYEHGYYTAVSSDMAEREVIKAGQKTIEKLPLKSTFWKVERGQVIDPIHHKPVVGDYDMLGVAPMKSKGSNVSGVPKDLADGDWTGPVKDKATKAINSRLDQDRVLHGAQDQHFELGLSEGPAYAIYPDGRVHMMADKAAQQKFYDFIGRQTGAGKYPTPKGPVVDELAGRRGR